MLHHLRGVYFNNGFSLFYILLGAVLVIFFPESNLKFFSNFMTTNLLSWFAVTIYYLMTPVGWTNLVWLFKGRCEPAKWVMLAPTIPTVLILGWASYWSAVGFKGKSMENWLFYDSWRENLALNAFYLCILIAVVLFWFFRKQTSKPFTRLGLPLLFQVAFSYLALIGACMSISNVYL